MRKLALNDEILLKIEKPHRYSEQYFLLFQHKYFQALPVLSSHSENNGTLQFLHFPEAKSGPVLSIL